jgi:hypothetical protein
MMTRYRTLTHTVLQVVAIVALLLVASPVVMFVIMFLEHRLTGTRHFMDGLEAIGLTKVLQAMFDALGING